MSGNFDGSDSMMEAYGKIRSAAGNAEWITEFKLIEYLRIKFFILLLKEFFNRGICCALIGNFPAYLVGVIRSFNRIVLAVAVTPSSFLHEIVKRNRTPNRSFWFGPFKFILDRTGVDFIHYIVVHESTFLFQYTFTTQKTL
jgi:hypothetical protein